MVTTTKYVWDPVFDCVTHELDENNAVKAVYHNEPQQYGGVLSQRRGNTSHYHHHDALGSTRFLTDSSGNVTDTYLNDAWGNSVASTGTTVNPFRWVGKYGYYTDDSTGQVYVRARIYQPTVARWTSLDASGFFDGPNRMCYTKDGPAGFIDPSGLVAIRMQFNAFIHKNLGEWLWEPRPIPLIDEGNVSETFQFKGDMRDFGEKGSSRMSFNATIDSCSIGIARAGGRHEMGLSHRRELMHCAACGKGYWKYWESKKGMLQVDRVNSYFDGRCQTVIDGNASGAYPFVPVPEAITPKIDYRVVFIINALHFDRVEVCVDGQHDRFPAFEAIADEKLLYQYDPKVHGHNGPRPSNLSGYMMRIPPGSCVILDKQTRCDCGGSCDAQAKD
ncbi:MAG: RHS repeat-associated core domain-containing protein [Planctomycetia bacterium]